MVLIVLHTDSSQTLLVSRGDVVGFWSWYDEMAYRVNYFQNQSDEEENIAGARPKEREIRDKSGFLQVVDAVVLTSLRRLPPYSPH